MASTEMKVKEDSGKTKVQGKGIGKKLRNWLIFIFLVLAVGAYFVVSSARKAAESIGEYQTAQVELGSLTASIGATGTVRANQTAVLIWQNTGAIGDLTVKPGDKAKTGDVLGSLSLAPLTQSTLESNLVTAQANLAEMTSPEAIANAKLAITTAQENVINAQSAVNNQQYWENDALIQNYYSKVVIAKANLDMAQEAYDHANVGEYINNAGEASLYQALYNAQQAYKNAQYYYSVYSQKPTERQLNEVQANLDLANATLTNAQIYLDVLTGGDVPTDATGTALLRLEQAKLAVQTAQDNLDAAKLTAPFNGTITEVNGMVGDQVSPGNPAFRLDDLSRLLVDVQVSEVDINSVQVGQTVTITLDAILGQEYHGQVVEVAQVGNATQGAVNFTVTVEVNDADTQVKPGMTAAVTVTVQQVDNALLIPNRAVRLVDGQRVVYIMSAGQMKQIQVTLGASSDTMSVVVEGDLKAGDTIILNPPANFGPGDGGGPSFMMGG